MRNYWSCSKFADWIRGTIKGDAKTSQGWREWEDSARTQHPVRYWIAEKGLDMLQDIIFYIPDKLYSVKYYINNRWVTKTHALTAHPRDIKPGCWRDVGYRFLPCLFNELQDFVEVEQAWHHVMWDAAARKKYKTPWWGVGWFRWRTWRCPEAGVAYLIWASELRADESWGMKPGDKGYGELTHQALAAQEILTLYRWWTETYRNRPDAMDASGWSAVCDKMRDSALDLLEDTKDPVLRREKDRAHKLLQKIEAEYEKEEDEMLIRLIKVRKNLWT